MIILLLQQLELQHLAVFILNIVIKITCLLFLIRLHLSYHEFLNVQQTHVHDVFKLQTTKEYNLNIHMPQV